VITTPTLTPILIRRADVPAIYGFSERQLKRWCAEGRLSRVYPAGFTGPCFLLRSELDDLVRKATVPPGKKAGRRPPRKEPGPKTD
jgi:hypothetical protein